MEGGEENVDESGAVVQHERTRARDPRVHGDAPMSFEFVTNDGNNLSQIRRHAMRESWRQRHCGRSNSPVTRTPPRAREILPRATQTRQSSSSTGREAEAAESSDEMEEDHRGGSDHLYSTGDDELVSSPMDFKAAKEEPIFTTDGIFLDLRHTMAPTSGPSNLSTAWSLSNIPSCLGQRPNPYQSIGDAEIDPFNSIRLSREDKELLHHCKPPAMCSHQEV